MSILPFLAAGGFLGLLQGSNAEAKEREDRRIAAAVARYAPFTGQAIPGIKKADMLGSIFQGGLTGAQVGLGIESMAMKTELNNALVEYLRGSGGAGFTGSGLGGNSVANYLMGSGF